MGSVRASSDRRYRKMTKRMGDAERASSEPPASSAQWRRRIGPLRSMRAESVAVSAARGASSTNPQISAPSESHDASSAILALADPGAAQPALEPFHLPLIGLVVVA